MIDFLVDHGFKKIHDAYRLETPDRSSIEILRFSELHWVVRFEEVSQDNVSIDYEIIEKTIDEDDGAEEDLQCDIIEFIEHHSM